MELLGVTILTAHGFAMLSVFCWLLASATRHGTLEPNGIFGLRTKATRSSPEAWIAGHQAALPLVRFTALVCAGFCALILIAGFAVVGVEGQNEAFLWIAVVLGYGTCTSMIIAAGVRADRAARQHLN